MLIPKHSRPLNHSRAMDQSRSGDHIPPGDRYDPYEIPARSPVPVADTAMDEWDRRTKLDITPNWAKDQSPEKALGSGRRNQPVDLTHSPYHPRGPDPRAHRPDPRAHRPDPRDQRPDPRDHIPDPRDHIPDPRDHIPDPRDQIPDPRAQRPDPRYEHRDPIRPKDQGWKNNEYSRPGYNSPLRGQELPLRGREKVYDPAGDVYLPPARQQSHDREYPRHLLENMQDRIPPLHNSMSPSDPYYRPDSRENIREPPLQKLPWWEYSLKVQ